MRRALVFTLSAFFALAAPAVAEAKELRGTVGPGFTIALVDESGARVTHVDPGEYTLVVQDNSIDHNFHLTGPGVNVLTEIEFVGTMRWTVTLTDGIYDFVCDPHLDVMSGRFAVGTATLPPAAPPARPPATTPPAARRLVATVGPGFTIALRTAAGARVTTLRRGTYTIVVRDRSRAHNFHLTGPRTNRRTTVSARGTFTWRVTLRPGRYRFVCDPHADSMRGSFRVT
jgi:plastocyanin